MVLNLQYTIDHKMRVFTLFTFQHNFYYGETNTDGLMPNLYADTLLILSFVPRQVYNDITSFYRYYTEVALAVSLLGV